MQANDKQLIVVAAAGLGLLYLLKKRVDKSSNSESGSLGGSDDMWDPEKYGFQYDPNQIIAKAQNPDQPIVPVVLPTSPENTNTPTSPNQPIPVIPPYVPKSTNQTVKSPYSLGSSIPVVPSTPTVGAASSNENPLLDVAAIGGYIGANVGLLQISKTLTKRLELNAAAKAAEESLTPVQRILRDPYRLEADAAKKVESKLVPETVVTGEKLVRESSGDIAEKTLLEKGGMLVEKGGARGLTKTIVNWIPLLNIPIAAGLDVWFSRNDPEAQRIDPWSALQAETAGEIAQIGTTAGAALAGGGIASVFTGSAGWLAGAGVNVATTEAAYATMGKSSIFTTPTIEEVAQNQVSTPPVSHSSTNYIYSTTPASTADKFVPTGNNTVIDTQAQQSVSMETAISRGYTTSERFLVEGNYILDLEKQQSISLAEAVKRGYQQPTVSTPNVNVGQATAVTNQVQNQNAANSPAPTQPTVTPAPASSGSSKSSSSSSVVKDTSGKAMTSTQVATAGQTGSGYIKITRSTGAVEYQKTRF